MVDKNEEVEKDADTQTGCPITEDPIPEENPKNEFYWKGGYLIVSTRSGKRYKFEEQEGSLLEESAKAATMKRRDRSGNMYEELKENVMYNKLVTKSCIDPIIKESEFEIIKLKGSETVTLKKAMMELYDIQSFLK